LQPLLPSQPGAAAPRKWACSHFESWQQALWTAAHHKLAIVFVVLANREYRILCTTNW
jgi:hypothetical protein